LSVVVELGVDDYAASNDGIFRAVDGDVVHGEIERGDSLGVGLEISRTACVM
jgi:hypothetical protein